MEPLTSKVSVLTTELPIKYHITNNVVGKGRLKELMTRAFSIHIHDIAADGNSYPENFQKK